ncbi:DUF484 family protein [Amaricoccus macauensis]|uniref:DUF484 family protein n=1 Tax=Amaricoccus macauensis TaxID=57001 RepID=UPI003C7B3A61
MTEDAAAADLKERILDHPGVILDDPNLMRALLAAERTAAGRNVVDLRGVLVERLEERIEQLEDTHREVLAAAYENVAGTNQIHRACLELLDAPDFAVFLDTMVEGLPRMLSIDIVRLGLEAPGVEAGSGLGPEGKLKGAVIALPEGGVDTYITHGRGLGPRQVTLRQLAKASPDIYGAEASEIRSETVLRLDLGEARRRGLLVFGSRSEGRFHPEQGTDLLAFFSGVFERALRRWIS